MFFNIYFTWINEWIIYWFLLGLQNIYKQILNLLNNSLMYLSLNHTAPSRSPYPTNLSSTSRPAHPTTVPISSLFSLFRNLIYPTDFRLQFVIYSFFSSFSQISHSLVSSLSPLLFFHSSSTSLIQLFPSSSSTDILPHVSCQLPSLPSLYVLHSF